MRTGLIYMNFGTSLLKYGVNLLKLSPAISKRDKVYG